MLGESCRSPVYQQYCSLDERVLWTASGFHFRNLKGLRIGAMMDDNGG